MKFQLYAVRIFTFKWPESIAFYREKLGLPVKFADEQIGWAEFDLGGASLGIDRQHPNDPEARGLVGRYVGISIQVNDIDAIYQELAAKGVEFDGPPEKQPWGGTLAHFRDPDGNVLTLLGGITE